MANRFCTVHGDPFSRRSFRKIAVTLVALAAVLMVMSPVPAQAARRAEMTGTVIKVIDGDSLMFRPDPGPAGPQRPLEVRLADIDAPEFCQEHGPESLAALKALTLNKPARLKPVARDRYGRQLARLTVDNMAVGPRLVEEGQAWSARWRNNRGPLMKQERMARALRRGLHAQQGAVLPTEFRRLNGRCGVSAR